MATRGRPPAPRGVFAFDRDNWVPPEAVVLDTNVVADALLPNEPEHASCLALMEQLAVIETVVVFNRMLEIELGEVLFNLALREKHKAHRLRHVRFDDRVRPRAARLLDDGLSAWEQMKATLSWSYVELQEVDRRVPELMKACGFQSYDAVHAATLMESGLTDFITKDAGFAKLSPTDAVLHTTQARVKNTRQRRKRAGF